MKKTFLLIFLSLFFTNSTFADWVRGSATKSNIFYYDKNSIVKDGEITYIWILVDEKKVGDYGQLSNKAYLPIKCKLKHFQIVQLIYYSGNMGTGNILERIDNPDIKWIAAPPNSAWEGLLKRVCAR